MEIWTQVFTRDVARLENRDWLVDQSGAVKPTTWWCARAWRWLGREPEVLKNGAAGFALQEHSKDAHAAAAGVADQGPVEPTARRGVGLIGTGRGHNGRAGMAVGREDTM
jgi:hypothetical protein